MPNQAEAFKLTLDETGNFKPIPNVPVHAFENLMNDQGLVRVKIVKDFAPYSPDPQFGWSIAGFDPAKSKRIYDLAAGFPCDEEGNPVPLEGELLEAPPAPDLNVAIPEDWHKGNHLPRIRLAMAIKGTTEVMDDKEARAIIQEELNRRQAHAA